MSNIWTDLRHRSFINHVVYSLNGVVLLKSLEIFRKRKTGIYLKDIISSMIESIGQENVVQFITDNGSNFTSIGDMFHWHVSLYV